MRTMNVLEHVGHDEEANVAASDIDLVQVADAPVAGGDGDILELDVHVVLGCRRSPWLALSVDLRCSHCGEKHQLETV